MTKPNRFVRYPLLGCLVLSAALLGAPGTATATGLDLEVRYWGPDLSGNLELPSFEVPLSLDLETGLGLEEDEFPEGRLIWRPSRRTQLRFGWMPIELSGSQMVNEVFPMLDDLGVIPARIDSELEIDYGRIGFAWQFLSSRDGRFRVGPIVEAKGFQGDARASVSGLPIALADSIDFETGFASVGLVLDAELSPRIHLFAEVTELVDDSDGELTDGEAGVRVLFAQSFMLTAGLRTLEIDVEDDGDSLELELDGVFVGLGFRF